MNFRCFLVAPLLILVLIWGTIVAVADAKQAKITLGGNTFDLEVVCEEVDRVRGLSGRKSLDDKQGMLFIFDRPARHGIWMKEMNFPIDIIWLDVFRSVTHIERNVSPETYPEVLSSPNLALYVLEVPANAGEGIELKMTAEFKDIPNRCF